MGTTNNKLIPISKPNLGQEESDAVTKVLKSGVIAQGEEVNAFEQEWAAYTGVKFAIATSNGTTALHIALACLNIGLGDEVITTPFSFMATASSILMQRATPVFCDIDPITYNIDPKQIENQITRKTRAIMVVHLYGQPCNMNPIQEIARKYQLYIIEDACQAHGAEYHSSKVGAIGDIGVFSFYPTKNITTGEGGMLTTDNADIADKARILRNHGQVQRYRHEILGYNYRMTNIAASIGRVQLKKLDQFNQKRIKHARYYNENLGDMILKPKIADHVKHVYHQYTIKVKDRSQFISYLEQNGIGYGIHYPVPIHKQPLFKQKNYPALPIAEEASNQVISIPVQPSLSTEDLEYIVRTINSYDSR